MTRDIGLPESMLACQIIEFNQPYKIHHIPTPQPSEISPHDLIVKIAVASLCHTDFLAAAGGMPGTPLPCTASHEGSGTVVFTGSAVQPSSFQVGDRVMCGLKFHPCGSCSDCHPESPEERRQYCKNAGYIGLTTHGCFAEYAVVDSRFSAKLPQSVSFETAAPLACAGCTIWRAVKRAEVKQGEWLGIVGAGGGLGHLGIQFAKLRGYKVVAVDAREEALALCTEFAADLVVDARSGDEEVIKKIHSVTSGEGVQATINASDHPSSVSLACAMTKMHGQLIQVALTDSVNIPYAELIFRDIRICGTLIGSGEEAKSMLSDVARFGVDVKTNPVYGLNEVPRMLDLAESRRMLGKAVVIVDPTQMKSERSTPGA